MSFELTSYLIEWMHTNTGGEEMKRYVFHIDANSAYLSWGAVYRLQHGEQLLSILTYGTEVGVFACINDYDGAEGGDSSGGCRLIV